MAGAPGTCQRSRVRVYVLAFAAGLSVAAAVAGFPALAADQGIAAGPGTSWSPSTVTINPGDTVTWSNATGIPHNVCVAKPGDAPGTTVASCTEFRNGNVSSDWSAYTNTHAFATAGTYQFRCQQHAGMVGTVQVGPTGTTTTSTGTGPNPTTTTTGTQTTTTPTQTTTTQTGPTQTGTQTDTTAPRFVGAVRRRAGRNTITLTFGASKAGSIRATVFRMAPGTRVFKRLGKATSSVHSGANTVSLSRSAIGKLRRGTYRVTLVLVDTAGHASAPRALTFKLP